MVINMDHNDIWKEKLELDKARRSALNIFLNDYDSKIYNPAIKKIREKCKRLGHKFSFHGYNLDSSHRIYKCNYCGVSKHEEN